MSGLAQRVARLQERIRRACDEAGRDPGTVELLPVSKRHPLERVQEAFGLGFRRFGENYVQEGTAKAAALPAAGFLLIGPLQRNKARQALEGFEEILTLDRPDLAARLRRLAADLDLVRPVWIQVGLWGEASKLGGCTEAELPTLLEALSGDPRLPLRGFMAIPPPDHPKAFTDLAGLRLRWEDLLGKKLQLSMGMSEDLEAAIRAGSDQVRIGTDFFGARGVTA